MQHCSRGELFDLHEILAQEPLSTASPKFVKRSLSISVQVPTHTFPTQPAVHCPRTTAILQPCPHALNLPCNTVHTGSAGRPTCSILDVPPSVPRTVAQVGDLTPATQMPISRPRGLASSTVDHGRAAHHPLQVILRPTCQSHALARLERANTRTILNSHISARGSRKTQRSILPRPPPMLHRAIRNRRVLGPWA